MRRLLTLLFVLAAVPASAQIGIPPSSLAPPVIVFPASAVNGAGLVTSPTGLTLKNGSAAEALQINWSDVSNVASVSNQTNGGTARNFALWSAGNLQLGAAGNSNYWQIRSPGILMPVDSDNGQDFGATTNRIRSFYVGTSVSVGAGPITFSGTAPTVTTAGTSPSISASNGAVTFRVNVGTGGTATTIVMGMPAATTGWNCTGSNLTAAAANRNPTGVLLEQSSTTTSVTMQYQTVATGVALAFVASDIVLVNCVAY